MKQTQRDDEGGQLPPAQPDSEGGSFGRWLRRHREVRGIDLREIADSSKIGISYLRAFEDDRFDLLPAEIFAKGFLRQYAAYVGLDPEEVVNFYLSARQAELDEPDEEPVRRPTRSPAGRFVMVALALLAVLALIFWWITQGRKAPATQAPVETPVVDSQPTVPPPPAAPVESPAPSPTDPPAPAATSPSPQTASPEPPRTDSSVASEVADDSLTVAIDFAGECWVEAVLDGVQRLAEIKVQGESLLLEADEAVDLKVGNVAVVQIEVNGLPYPLERRAGTAVRSVRIDRSILETLQRQAEGSE